MSSASATSTTAVPAAVANQGECRLSIGPPNLEAKHLHADVTQAVLEYDDRNFGNKYGCAIFWAIFGVLLLITILSTTGAAAGAFIVYAVCVAFGLMCHLSWAEEPPELFVNEYGISLPRLIMADKVEDRLYERMEKQRILLSQLQKSPKAPQAIKSMTLRELMADVFPTHEVMNYAACVPESGLCSYALAWTSLYEKYAGHPRAAIIKELHDNWQELIGISNEWAGHVIKKVDRKRLIARREANNTVQGMAAGAVTTGRRGGGKKGGVSYEKYLRSRIEEFQDTLQDMRQANKDDVNLRMKLNYLPLKERSMPHDVSRQHAIRRGAFVGAICMQGVFIVALAGSVVGTMFMMSFTFLAAAVSIALSLRLANQGLNTLEYLCRLEELVRQALEAEIEKNKLKDHVELTETTNKLRRLLMESYYDTLGIHLETELMTYGELEPTPEYDPTPLFGTRDKLLVAKSKAFDIESGHTSHTSADSCLRLRNNTDETKESIIPEASLVGGDDTPPAVAVKPDEMRTVAAAKMEDKEDDLSLNGDEVEA